MASEDAREERWRPSAAFVHPLFLAALIILVLNDHWLKGSGILSGVVTGKLSDVAGLLVAPAVLAWVVRARTARGWTIAHIAVAIGFAALELSPSLVRTLESIGADLGVPFHSWPDPSDLLALPAAYVSLFVLGPRARRREHRLAPSVGVIALVACTATSQAPPPRYPFRPAGLLETDVYLRHTGAEDLVIHVRRIRDQAALDCDRLDDPPEDQLKSGDFGDDSAWTLARGDAVPLWDRLHDAPERECYAVRIAVYDHEWILTWRAGDPPIHDVPIRLEPNVPAEREAVVASPGEEPPRVPPGVHVLRPR